MTTLQQGETDVRKLPVPANDEAAPANREVRALEPRRRWLPAVAPNAQVVVAAGGFAAGAAALATVRAVRTRKRLRFGRRRRKEVQRSVVATRSFLVDVHLLGR
jgi:hypothetical protein